MNLSQTLSAIELNTERLIQLNHALMLKISELEQENVQLKEQVERSNMQLRNIQESKELEKIVGNLGKLNENKFEIKQKITDFVREIDRCIEILSYDNSMLK